MRRFPLRLRALRLGCRLALHGGRTAGLPRGVSRDARRTAGGAAVDIYRRRGPARGAWVAVHGLTVNGGREPRLVAFASALAAEGITCVVPTLPGLSSLRLDPHDLELLAEVVREASAEQGLPVGLIGFSLGGSLALLAAAGQRPGPCVRRVIAFGACHRLAPVLEEFVRAARTTPVGDQEVERSLFAYEVLVLGGYAPASFNAATLEQLRDLAARDCEGASFAEKRAFHERHLREAALGAVALPPDRLLAQLSPAGNLTGIACPVTLLHDPHDQDVPPAHAEAIVVELRSVAPGHDHRLLLTPLIAHVSPSPVLHPVAAVRFVDALAELFP